MLPPSWSGKKTAVRRASCLLSAGLGIVLSLPVAAASSSGQAVLQVQVTVMASVQSASAPARMAQDNADSVMIAPPQNNNLRIEFNEILLSANSPSQLPSNKENVGEVKGVVETFTVVSP